MKLETGKELVSVDHLLVERDVLNIIERIHAYDPNLRVLYLDSHEAEFFDAPWMIGEMCPDGLLRKVFTVWELNESVLERLYNADTARHGDSILADLERHNNKIRADQQRRYEDERSELKDQLAHVIKNPRTSYTFYNSLGQLVTLDDHLGIVKRK